MLECPDPCLMFCTNSECSLVSLPAATVFDSFLLYGSDLCEVGNILAASTINVILVCYTNPSIDVFFCLLCLVLAFCANKVQYVQCYICISALFLYIHLTCSS